ATRSGAGEGVATFQSKLHITCNLESCFLVQAVSSTGQVTKAVERSGAATDLLLAQKCGFEAGISPRVIISASSIGFSATKYNSNLNKRPAKDENDKMEQAVQWRWPSRHGQEDAINELESVAHQEQTKSVSFSHSTTQQ
ncbi:hypothetical protein THAOC_02454, partial [Thalassiosira oceanica]